MPRGRILSVDGVPMGDVNIWEFRQWKGRREGMVIAV